MRRLLAAVLCAGTLAAPALAQPAAPKGPTIAVIGTGEAELKPDLVRIQAMVTTQADTATQAADLNKAASDRVLARLQALGVKREDIRTLSVQVFPTRYRPDGTEMRTGRYNANHQLRISTREIDAAGRIAGEILASGDTLVQNVAFGLDKETAADDEARRAAVRNARHQAEVLTEAAGVALGRLVEIRNAGVQPASLYDDGLSSRAARSQPQEMSLVPPATVRTTASVQMVWEIAPVP